MAHTIRILILHVYNAQQLCDDTRKEGSMTVGALLIFKVAAIIDRFKAAIFCRFFTPLRDLNTII